jgi:predicted amidophosphoribosyltransferase
VSDAPCCAACGQPLPRTGAPDSLERICRERGLPVTVDGRVSEAVAAEILGRAPDTLRNWAYASAPVPFVKVRGRRTYRLQDLAAFLAK